MVCFVRYADTADRPMEHSREYYDSLFNDMEGESVIRYYSDMSYGQLKWRSVFVDVDYVDQFTRGYYRKSSESNPDGYTNSVFGMMRVQSLVANAAKFASEHISPDVIVDATGDGRVDNFIVVMAGNSEASSSDGELWPHQSSLSLGGSASINDMKVGSYLMIFDGLNANKTLNLGVIAHEMMHSVGAYDLYTHGSNDPVGIWDVMSDNQTTPQAMTAYMRHTYGKTAGDWIPTITELTENGSYTLKPLNSDTPDDVAYIIRPDASRREYFMVEYRRKEGWDNSLTGSGIICYRINPDAAGNLSAAPGSQEVYVFRPSGSLTAVGNLKQANLSANVVRKEFGTASAKSYPFYSDGSRADFTLTDIGRSEADGITFTLNLGNAGINGIMADNRGIVCSGALIKAQGASVIAIYSVQGMLLLSSESEMLDASDLISGLYVAVATYPDGSKQTLKFSK